MDEDEAGHSPPDSDMSQFYNNTVMQKYLLIFFEAVTPSTILRDLPSEPLAVYKGMANFSPLVLVLIRQLFRSLLSWRWTR